MTTQAKPCEACGSHGHGVEIVHVRTTNGGLKICRQCLDDINRKSPLLAQARRETLEEAAKHCDDKADDILAEGSTMEGDECAQVLREEANALRTLVQQPAAKRRFCDGCECGAELSTRDGYPYCPACGKDYGQRTTTDAEPPKGPTNAELLAHPSKPPQSWYDEDMSGLAEPQPAASAPAAEGEMDQDTKRVAAGERERLQKAVDEYFTAMKWSPTHKLSEAAEEFAGAASPDAIRRMLTVLRVAERNEEKAVAKVAALEAEVARLKEENDKWPSEWVKELASLGAERDALRQRVAELEHERDEQKQRADTDGWRKLAYQQQALRDKWRQRAEAAERELQRINSIDLDVTCGELSVDDCNARYVLMRERAAEAERKLKAANHTGVAMFIMDEEYAALAALVGKKPGEIAPSHLFEILPRLWKAEQAKREAAERELSKYRSVYGCWSCGEPYHGDSMCPPFEVRTTGMTAVKNEKERLIAALRRENAELRAKAESRQE